MDSKWGGKTETINMQLNVEQVCENLKMVGYHTKDHASYTLLDLPKAPDSIHVKTPWLLSLLFEHGRSFTFQDIMYSPYFQVILVFKIDRVHM